MGLSSNILWHQTNYQNLTKILEEKELRYSYSLERCFSIFGEDEKENEYKLAFPMISMCDFPFSEITDYMGKYGNSILGLSRNWGLQKGFCPVWYCSDDSKIIEYLRHYCEKIIREEKYGNLGILLHLLSYMKPFESELKTRKYKNYRFYDEREIRLVAPLNKTNFPDGTTPILLSGQYNTYKEKHGNSLLNFGVDFDWGDIKYIVVDKCSQIKKIRELLEKFGCTNENIMIFDSAQVKEDFIGVDHNRGYSKDEKQEILSKDSLKNAISKLLE